MIEVLGPALLVAWAGLSLAVGVFFGASFLYFVCMHRNGAADYAAKTLAIGLLTTPLALLLTLMPIVYGLVLMCRAAFRVVWLLPSVPDKSRGSEERAETDGVIVHLVHGTFEPDAPWTMRGSRMREAIEGIGDGVEVVRFSWTGHNTRSARSKAAKELAAKITESPSSKHYIVAHSHGGNIVREMSHTFPETAAHIRGVCLLSPPFIFRRKIPRTAEDLILMNGLGFVLATQIPVAVLLVPFGMYWPYAAMLTSALAFMLEISLSKRCGAALTAEMRYDREEVEFRNVQIFHAIGDEADSALRFVSFLHESCFGVLSQLKAASKLARVRANWPYVASYIFLAVALGLLALMPTLEWFWIGIPASALVLIGAAHIAQLRRPSRDDPQVLLAAALPIVTFSFWLAIAKAMAFGDYRLIFCPDVFIASSETPKGDHNVQKFAPESDGAMIHSTHSHSEAILSVVAWLQSSLDE